MVEEPDNHEDNHEAETIDKEEKIISLPSCITDEDKSALFKEMTVILTRKWKKNNQVVFGCSENDLLLATRMDISSLRDLIKEYTDFVNILGLEVVEYTLPTSHEIWYCIRSEYYAPSELEKNELLVLGTIIGLYEETKLPIASKSVKDRLVISGKIKEYIVDETLRELTKLGYITRIKNKLVYNYRTEIEFGVEERRKIASEFRKL